MSKQLYIVRGLPSAGKTTLARVLAPQFYTSMDLCRTDHEGRYTFEPGSYGAELTRTQQTVERWMRAGATPIAVANVSAARFEVTLWTLMAIQFGYTYTVVHVETALDDRELAARSATRCPAAAIAAFRARWQPWAV
jgi:predicted kinase